MSKKVGILTFHAENNYGAVLQAYATKRVCERLGFEAHVIDYNFRSNSENSNEAHKINPVKNLPQTARNLLFEKALKQKKEKFDTFRDNCLSLSQKCEGIDDIKALNYDAYISGSDQIWNYKITGNKFDDVFFLNFDTDAKKVIYAASSQDTPFPIDKEEQLAEMINKTEANVGIREEKLRDYVHEITDRKYPIVLDPTLLAGKEILNEITTGIKIKKPYILMYQIDTNPYTDICIKSLKKRFGCNVYSMHTPYIGSFSERKGNFGPREFMYLLKNAQFLVTNSFHGIAISMLFEKQFYVYENGGVMSRIDGLLNLVGLKNQKVKNVKDIDLNNKIDYSKVTPILEAEREKSMEFLENSLSDDNYISYEVSSKDKGETLIPMKNREKKDCSGCSACVDACPVSAIEMKPDKLGFLYPEIDEEKCIHCGKCDKVCGFIKVPKRQPPFDLPKAFGVKHSDLSARLTSRSGGAFIAFSDYVLDKGGVVYGAVMQSDFSVKHERAETKSDRDKMKKAKYVQSDTTEIYPLVKSDLADGRFVLFSGTPCQISGLYAYLKSEKVDIEKLYTCDLVCHGVPSPSLWLSYIKFVEKKFGGKVTDANFRDKDFGWDSHCETFKIEGRDKKVAICDYTELFYQHIMFRDSCYNCQFSNINRVADISLADFWGIEKNDKSFDDNKGVSLVLVNNEKGNELFDIAKKDLTYFECDVRNCLQPTLVKPSVPSPRREEFIEDYMSMPFEQLIKKYITPKNFKGKLKRTTKQIMYKMGLRQHP